MFSLRELLSSHSRDIQRGILVKVKRGKVKEKWSIKQAKEKYRIGNRASRIKLWEKSWGKRRTVGRYI